MKAEGLSKYVVYALESYKSRVPLSRLFTSSTSSSEIRPHAYSGADAVWGLELEGFGL